MSVGIPTFSSERLREARLARGLYKKALGELVGISGTAIANYEDGSGKPQRHNLKSIADKLDFPESFFLKPAWPEKLEPLFWRSRASDTKSAREMSEQRMIWLCEIFSTFEEHLDFPKLTLPEIDLPDDFRLITPEIIEQSAESIRSSWGFGQHPIPDMILALENIGIPVVCLDIPSEKQDGFYFRSKLLKRPFVGINTYNVSASRARFDAAHEFAHILLHRNVTAPQSRDPVGHKMLEQQANRFAGALLFPRQAFLDEVEVPTLDYFCALKKRWGMSIAAMVYRAFDLEIIDSEMKSSLYRNMTRRRWRGPLMEPFDSLEEMPLEEPRMLRRGTEALLQERIFTRSTLRSSLTLPQREIEQLVGVNPGFLNEAEFIELDVRPRRKQPIAAVDLESSTILEFPTKD